MSSSYGSVASIYLVRVKVSNVFNGLISLEVVFVRNVRSWAWLPRVSGRSIVVFLGTPRRLTLRSSVSVLSTVLGLLANVSVVVRFVITFLGRPRNAIVSITCLLRLVLFVSSRLVNRLIRKRFIVFSISFIVDGTYVGSGKARLCRTVGSSRSYISVVSTTFVVTLYRTCRA